MRPTWVLACALVALGCAERATGLEPQAIIAPDYLWLWWLPALSFMVTAIRTAMGARG